MSDPSAPAPSERDRRIATFLLSAALGALFVVACSAAPEDASSEAPVGAGEAGSGGGPGAAGDAGGHGGAADASADLGDAAPDAPATSADGAADGTADLDAGLDAIEAGGATDAAWGACVVEGVAGDCVDVGDCAALADHVSTPGHCPGPASVECCTPYGLALCDPSVVQQPNVGHTTEPPGQGGCPAGMIRVDTFCLDQFEASLVKVSDGTPWSPYLNPGSTAVRAVSVGGAIPQGYIDGIQAADACANAGKRLCTDAEWLRACQGPGETTYPYGDALQPGACNDHRAEHPAVQYFGTNASWIFSEIDNACLNQLPLSLDPAGSLPGCVTAEGAYDMMGNLHEWTADPAGTFRGGYYVDTATNGAGCLYVTTAHGTSHWDYSTGFRCCAD